MRPPYARGEGADGAHRRSPQEQHPTRRLQPHTRPHGWQTDPADNPGGNPLTDPTPTIDDLRAIVGFIRARAMDEAQAAGRMEFYRNNGATIQPKIPKDAFPGSDLTQHRANIEGWLDEHSADRFLDLAGELASMADGLVDLFRDVPETFAPYRARMIWRRLTGAARLWDTHPGFNPAWAKDAEQ